MCDTGDIQDYDDLCDPKTDKILFRLKTTREFTRQNSTERKLMETLHLVKSLPEILTCIDADGRVKEFKSVQEMLDAYIEMRLGVYKRRKEHILAELDASITKMRSKCVFIEAVISKRIAVSGKKKAEILKQLEACKGVIEVDGSYDYLLKMPIWSLTHEMLQELKASINAAEAERDAAAAATLQDMWLADLKELKKVLK